MNGPTVGVVGPRDLVDKVAGAASGIGPCKVTDIPYRSERETARLVNSHRDEVDAWLFTGIVPRTIAESQGVLDRPAEHVSYSGVTLLSTILRLLSESNPVHALSIDTLDASEVTETLDDAGLAGTRVEVLEYTEGQSRDDIVAFHRDARTRLGSDCIALTCLRSAFSVLNKEMPTVRMVPSQRDIREATSSLLLKTESHWYSDAQVAVGLAEVSEPNTQPAHLLAPLLGSLGASTFELGDGRLAFVTTRGPLSAATNDFSALPFLAEVTDKAESVHIGLGVSRSAADAESLAHKASTRARAVGRFAVAIAEQHHPPYVLASNQPTQSADGTADLRQLASRAGVSKQTLIAIREHVERQHSGAFTTHDLAELFNLHDRSARRLMRQLDRAGIVVASDRRVSGRGRPTVVYQLIM